MSKGLIGKELHDAARFGPLARYDAIGVLATLVVMLATFALNARWTFAARHRRG